MIDPKSLCDCLNEGKPLERNGHTASCNRLTRKLQTESLKPPKTKKPIAKTSDKMNQALAQYRRKKRIFIAANPICAVFKDRPSVDIHHMMGRATIELLLDDNYWLAVSREAHQKIELNPEWAKEQGYSLTRLGKLPDYSIANEPHAI